MDEIPETVRRLGLHGLWETPGLPGVRIVEGTHCRAALHPFPFAQEVEPTELAPHDAEAAVWEAREIVRGHGRTLLVWWLGDDYTWFGDRLQELGIRNEDTPGLEAVENVLALVRRPSGPVPEDVAVTPVESFEDFALSHRIAAEVFGATAAMRKDFEANLPDRYAEHTAPGSPVRQLNAAIDGRVVGTGGVALADAGANLLGGCVIEDSRGRGVYRALVAARWELAVARGTPALTVQAGRMSRPVLERLGFQFIAANRIYVDDFGQD
jgi:GNAT superfamily N-acetyltransferase